MRVVLLADRDALHCYGPVLRRFTVGLLDEVGEMTLVCPEGAPFVHQVPSPPVRLVFESSRPGPASEVDLTGRRVWVGRPYLSFLDRLRPDRRVRRLAETLRPFKPTLLHALSENIQSVVGGLSRALQVNYLVSVLALDRCSLDVSDAACAAVLCCNSTVARSLRRAHPRAARRVHVLPIGTHVSTEVCCLSHDGQAPVVLCCSPLQVGRGLPPLIRAIRRLKDRGRRVHLMLLGRGSAEHDLRRLTSALGLIEQVHFGPPVTHMLRGLDAHKTIFREADVFVQPFPLRSWRPELLEALSVGNAVVVIRGPDNDLIVEGKTARVLPADDDARLADCLEALLADPQQARRFAENAQRYLRKHFLAGRMVARLGRAYRLAQAQPHPSEA